jgi:hypothetical protein
MTQRFLPALAALVGFVASAGAAQAAVAPTPGAEYRGRITFSKTVRFRLTVAADGATLAPSVAFIAARGQCTNRASGYATGSTTRVAVPIVDGRFAGSGTSRTLPGVSGPLHLRWTIRGEFTAPNAASGTIRVTVTGRNQDGSRLRCDPGTGRFTVRSVGA